MYQSLIPLFLLHFYFSIVKERERGHIHSHIPRPRCCRFRDWFAIGVQLREPEFGLKRWVLLCFIFVVRGVGECEIGIKLCFYRLVGRVECGAVRFMIRIEKLQCGFKVKWITIVWIFLFSRWFGFWSRNEALVSIFVNLCLVCVLVEQNTLQLENEEFLFFLNGVSWFSSIDIPGFVKKYIKYMHNLKWVFACFIGELCKKWNSWTFKGKCNFDLLLAKWSCEWYMIPHKKVACFFYCLQVWLIYQMQSNGFSCSSKSLVI